MTGVAADNPESEWRQLRSGSGGRSGMPRAPSHEALMIPMSGEATIVELVSQAKRSFSPDPLCRNHPTGTQGHRQNESRR